MKQSNRWLSFLFVLGILINVLVMNDVASLFGGAERNVIGIGNGHWLTALQLSLVDWLGPIAEYDFMSGFWRRVPSVFAYLIGLGSIYFWAPKIFGKKLSISWLLVMGSCFLMTSGGKLASFDAFLCTAHLLVTIGLIGYLKTKQVPFFIMTVLGFMVGLSLNFPATALFAAALIIGLLFIYKKIAVQSFTWLVPLLAVLTAGLYFLNNPMLLNNSQEVFYLPFLNFKNLLFLIVGVGPWIIFIPAAIKEIFTKVRKGEELSKLATIFLLASLLVNTEIFTVALGFAIAIQAKNVTNPNYPHFKLIKSMAVFHLVLVFCLGTYGMINGFYIIGGTGFRAVLIPFIAYWMLTLFSVIALYGKKYKQFIFLVVSAGLAGYLLFWVRAYPFIESQRNYTINIHRMMSNYESELKGKLLIDQKIDSEAFINGDPSIAFQKKVEVTPYGVVGKLDSTNTEGKILLASPELYEDLLEGNAWIDSLSCTMGTNSLIGQRDTVYLLKFRKRF